MLRDKRILTVALMVVCLAAPAALAVPTVSTTVTPVAGGYQYMYEIGNPGPTEECIFDAFLLLPDFASTAIFTPMGWFDMAGPGNNFAQWTAFDIGADICEDETLGGFGLIHPLGPGPGLMELAGMDPVGAISTYDVPIEVPGEAPGYIPEPTTLALCGLGLGGLLARTARRRRRKV